MQTVRAESELGVHRCETPFLGMEVFYQSGVRVVSKSGNFLQKGVFSLSNLPGFVLPLENK